MYQSQHPDALNVLVNDRLERVRADISRNRLRRRWPRKRQRIKEHRDP